MAVLEWNAWKLVTVGIAVAITTALVTGLVVANLNDKPLPQAGPPAQPAKAERPLAEAPRTPVPHAASRRAVRPQGPSTSDVLQKALIGGALGAGVGAAGGAIAGGGSGAGKGAAIGGIVGATAGTLYGLNHR